ncbi:hypothetical protein BsWGS_23451 [Bradybaena similaris]
MMDDPTKVIAELDALIQREERKKQQKIPQERVTVKTITPKKKKLSIKAEDDKDSLDQPQKAVKKEKTKNKILFEAVAVETVTTIHKICSAKIKSLGLTAEGYGSTEAEARLNAAMALREMVLQQQAERPGSSKDDE